MTISVIQNLHMFSFFHLRRVGWWDLDLNPIQGGTPGMTIQQNEENLKDEDEHKYNDKDYNHFDANNCSLIWS